MASLAQTCGLWYNGKNQVHGQGGLTLYLKLNGYEISCEMGIRWLDALELLPEQYRVRAPLGVSVQGRTFSLNDPVEEYAHARILTYANEEGRRIYERSLQLLFLTAVHRLRPDAHVRIEHSFGQGLYIVLVGEEMSAEFVAEIEKEMRALVARDLPILRKNVTTDDAQEYFARTGQTDRLRILDYRQYSHFTLYRIDDGPEDYFYGEMTPSTGFVNVFSLVPYGPGVVMMQPDIDNPEHSAPFKDLPKLWRIYQETAEWNKILRCENAADLNEMIDSHHLREFIRVSEALQERKIQSIADRFIASGARLILIAGPSSSGKTTFAHRLSIALRVQGLRPVKVSLDDYYRNRNELPREADGSIDLERIDTLDTALISDHLKRLMDGETVELPEYDFNTGMRREQTHPFRVEAGQPIIIEGIHGLNEQLTEGIDRKLKFKIYISALTMLNLDDHNRIRTTDARLLRRIVRDYQFRGTPPEATMAMWNSVRHGEENYIFPYQEEADAMFNSSLTYELSIMKKYAYPALLAVKPDSPHYTLARRLVKFLNYIQTADVEDEIPVNSLLREFIGGCCFYRETD